ncbi:MAG: PolC-type DNA polymerase III, partial [Lachnospiraceae bacterium]|nr:PolC-type DNA polymerase III [Candidatus Minthocola equi]
DIITTHFDYHSIDKNLLKFDILGHDDPTMVKCLQDFTGLDPRTIPLDDPDTMQIFKDTSTIGITPEDIGGTLLGTLGIPEFGTDFAMQMLIEAAPQNFSDLALIAGLAHGTDVWVGNARDLILSGTVTLQTAICTRDDIMLYLIRKGLPPEKAFDIMECVRKGKVANGAISEEQSAEYCKLMKDNDVPDWYIGSCQKIKYMFPKAHAVAYVMMAWRVAYYKVHYPLEYYASYFSIRADGMNYETMCQGADVLARKIADYRQRRDTLSDKEKIELRDMRIAEEMYARGIEFMPIDIYRANAKYCKIVDGKIMPGWISIAGLGEIVAEQAAAAGKDGPYSSIDSFSSRTGMSKKLTETVKQLGILAGLPDSDQLSLFDLM